MTRTLHLALRDDDERTTPLDVPIDQVVLVGYTGRDRAAVRRIVLLGHSVSVPTVAGQPNVMFV